jgi:dynein heavy chain
MAEGGAKEIEPRLKYIISRAMASFQIAKSKIDKVKSSLNENTVKSLDQFLNNDDVPFVFFFPGAETFEAMREFPATNQLKKKCLLAHRSSLNTHITKDNYMEKVLFMEFSKTTVWNLHILSHSVYLTVLSNQANQRGWSDLICKDLMDKYHVYLANLHVTSGLMEGKTLLPLPQKESPDADSKDRVHVLEGAVITWTKQIRNVLNQDPEKPLKDGLNPEPLAELRFWRNKAQNLNTIYAQLQFEGLKKTLKFLEQNKSTYTNPFSKLQREVDYAREDANDNVKFLSTMEPLFTKLGNESTDFHDITDTFEPIFHHILLIWKYSKFYNTPARIGILIRMICNAIISQAQRYVSGPMIFGAIQNDETADAVNKLEKALSVCNEFREKYFVFKDIAEQQGSGGWKIQSATLFARLDVFRERCRDILDFTRTIVQYFKLERVEIGGTKGKSMSMQVVGVFDEFKAAVEIFQQVTYDIMHVEEQQFDEDFYRFRCSVKELDRRLATILSTSFDDLDTIPGRLKLLDNFEGLLERPILQDELEQKYALLLLQYKDDALEVQNIFQDNKTAVSNNEDEAPIYSNMPPVTGAVFWANSLRQRLLDPMMKIRLYSDAVREVPEDFREIEKLFQSIMSIIDAYESNKYQTWESDSVDPSRERLKMRLLRRMDKTGLLKVNFDPMLTRLLREVRYFLLYTGKEIALPSAALDIYERVDTYRSWNGELDIIVQKYNAVLTELLPVEEPLLEDRIAKMDAALSSGLTELKWKSDDKIPAFIAQAQQVVGDVSGVVDAIKNNLKKISATLSKWCEQPLLKRKAKPMAPEEFDAQHKSSVGVTLHTMSEDGKEIHKMIKDSSEALKVSKVAFIWKNYVDFVNNIVIEGFVSAIAVSLQFLCEILDPLIIARHDMQPLFDVKVELTNKEVVFVPPFMPAPNVQCSLRGVLDGWLKDFFAMATTMQRVDSQTGDYLNEMKEHFQMQCLLALVSELIDNTEAKCMEYRETFLRHSFLWTASIQEAFDEFLVSDARELVKYEDEEGLSFTEIMTQVGVDLGARTPPMDAFDKEIIRFAQLRNSIADVKAPIDIHWLRVNAFPVKMTLVQFASKWEAQYTDFLREHTEKLLDSSTEFISKVRSGLMDRNPVDEPDNNELLYAVMTCNRDVKLAMEATKKLFPPIREQVATLKKHGVQMTDERLQDLDQAPARWDEVVRTSFDVKESLLPLRANEIGKIRNQIDAFSGQVEEYRKEFCEHCPFVPEFSYEDAYATIDNFLTKTQEISARAREYNNLERLFDIAVSGYRQLKECSSDLVLLKNLWDAISLIKTTFEEWNTTLWDKIDTDDLMMRTKDLVQQVKVMPKEVRTWKLYAWLQDEVKKMATVLPLVNDLHSDTMRDRHWKQIMVVTGKSFEKGPEFCFKDLLDLELHNFADDVSETVDQSAKEAKIDKKLTQIRTTWQKLSLEFEFDREDCPLLKDLGETVEILEGHALEMMGMTSQGRFIEFCQSVVDEWALKLRTVESVLGVWQKVQGNWCRLEPIFMLSDDIRSQLPDESKRFETLDAEWKDLMMDASSSSNCVEICCAEGREDVLVRLHDTIESCEKALNDYLEQKKKAFPRFYFVANQALLSILSNGNKPLKVAEFMGDVFDGVKTLDFSKAADTGKIACGHISKDTERVPWHEDLALEGAVETYLSNLEYHLRAMMRDILEQSRVAADNWEVDNPREKWLGDYAVQLALVVTQIVWTEETSRVFDDMEGGSETAMKDYKRVCDDRINKLIQQVQLDLSADLRNKIITIITIDVHARDMIEKYVQLKLTDQSVFQWQSQLRFYWGMRPNSKLQNGVDLVSVTDDAKKTCIIKICDWVTLYLYEYVGNCGRLVITPLTDRCYITLSQAMNLILGAAPAGPAGTGKTETTKDLSRALGLPIMVFNCSDQMSYLTMANIFMGLGQTGAWGCFDEFNRISIEVLSVVSTQYKTILDAIRENVKTFVFMDEEIKMVSTTGSFITMNPGYAGRTELPENLKALFRSCAMVVPDLVFICENMLMSEGFVVARALAQKFVCLYTLCKELLSKQMHYDWGLRAVKSLLRQAGKLKRGDPDMDEYPILMRALRDFNTPKITTDDMPIFLRLIMDLFPGIIAETKFDVDFEKICRGVILDRGLQGDDGFVTKVVSLLDILFVRHCCFIIGPPGSSKTEVWKSLLGACKSIGQDGKFETLNPKAITSDELYGIMTKTKEWRDGAIAVVMRNMSKNQGSYTPAHQHKWVILDGDIDAEWIESMNTVMDDNKILTLVSNERIPFTPTMRMLLEIQDMKHASPATVSRGGVLFINETDVGWKPYVESWREKMDATAQSTFYLMFSNYFEANADFFRKSFGFTCPMLDMGFVQSICCFVNALLNYNTKENMEAVRAASVEDQKMYYEGFFVYALMWAVGGAVADDKISNYRKVFSSWVKGVAKNPKMPDQGDAFDYRFEPSQQNWVHWEKWMITYNPVAERMYQNIIISTVEIERLKYILGLHVQCDRPVLYVGIAGTGKTTIVKDYLSELGESRLSAMMNLNSYSDSFAFQKIMEGYLDKRTGRTFGPPGNKKCVMFIDDLNMPATDKYETQSAIMLLCQITAHGSIFDRDMLDERKDIMDLQFCAAMNPKGGNFMTHARLQVRFTVLTTFTAGADVVSQIYSQILGSHLAGFDTQVQKVAENLVAGTTEVLQMILNTPTFLPSALKFHYQFNLKDTSNIFQGLLNSNPALYKAGGVTKYARLWYHELQRVFSDRLISQADEAAMQSIFEAASKKHMSAVPSEELFAENCLFTSFMSEHAGSDKMYMAIPAMDKLKKTLEEKLAEYNETFAEMNLVLFGIAMAHICRICRIVDLPCGNALLVGVGGSGKQSLARLSCFIMKVDVLNILVTQSYGVPDLLLDLQEMYKKAAVKPGTPHAFLMTDGQIASERFLVYINDLLSSGNIPNLFTREEMDGHLGAIRNLAKAAGVPDDRGALFSFFLDRVRRNLHLVLCHSPVGDAFRIRGRKFPALISCSVIDEFHPWPRDALEDVANRFNSAVSFGSDEILEKVGAQMAELHLSIDDANTRFLAAERRHNYTTAKSFLELIDFYLNLLKKKQGVCETNIERLDKGLTIMKQVKDRVDGLKEDLKVKMVQVKEKKDSTDVLIAEVTVASEKAAIEENAANVEAEATNKLASEAATIKAEADGELQEAMPAMEAAKEAVNCLNKTNISELKTLGKPPGDCVEVTAAVAYLLNREKKKADWKYAQKMMGNPGAFLEQITEFDAENIPDFVLDNVRPIITQPFFTFENVKTKSTAAAYLANWVINIVAFNTIYKKVAPLMEKVRVSSETKETAEAALAIVMARLAEVQEKVATLNANKDAAVAEKERVEAEAEQCLQKLALAERLVNGLADEEIRWTATVEDLGLQAKSFIGDCLLASAFVGYISPFNAAFRGKLVVQWLEDIKQRAIPHTEGIDALKVLTDEAAIAQWMNEGLPADRISVENACVVTACARWPLMIDPQLQGVKWIKQRFSDSLTCIQFTQNQWLQKVQMTIQMGDNLLIEAVGQDIEAILEPLLARAVIRRGRSALIIKLGGEEVDYDPKFRLYIQTKLSNPHYRPELFAQCTIVNFIVTPEGLEDQILAMVVNVEKPELEQQKQELVRRQNEFKVTLAGLEDDLLSQLAGADPATILDNIALIEGLEETKKTSAEIAIQVKLAVETEVMINTSREEYRPVAAEGSMIFFLIIQLCIVQHMYQYSLDSFVTFLFKAIEKTEACEDIKQRTELLISSIRIVIFRWVNRGLFERHKIIFCGLLTFRLLQRGLLKEEYNPQQFQFLLRSPQRVDVENPLTEWLPNPAWYCVQKLIDLDGFSQFAQNMEKDAPNRFKDWFNEIAPEDAKLPLDWKKLDQMPFQKLLVLRCMRPDRMTIALQAWIRDSLPNGKAYVDCDAGLSFGAILEDACDDASSVTPIFFVLSPGADPVKEVEAMGKRQIGLQQNVNYHNVAMGQGQDVVAMAKMEMGHKEGHWVMLQNIHLMPRWCVELEKKMDGYAIEGSHPNFRLFLSADPSPGIPIGILDRSVKLTNEPPQGLNANLVRAFANFKKEEFEDRDSKVKAIVFGLCHFHSVMLERKKFGPMGYNMMYPFATGDLRDSASILYNYLESNASGKVPWDDLRYLFGEIMYGGHIVDDWDRKLCKTYLEFYMQDNLLDETELAPYCEGKLTCKSPNPGEHQRYIEHIDAMPGESPMFYGLHPNAEIGFRTTQCNDMFGLLMALQPRDTGGDEGGGDTLSPMQIAEAMCNDIFEDVKEIKFPVEDIQRSLSDEEKGPYQFVFLQECTYMGALTGEMARSLAELQLGFKGELTMSEPMEALYQSLYLENIPAWWQKLGFPSTRPLASWLLNLKDRCAQLDEWTADPIVIPKVVDISRLFNPQSYLTAIKQKSCQEQMLELDKLMVFTDVTKREKAQVESASRDGAYVEGLYLEGCRWDPNGGSLEESKPKEMFSRMPVVNCKAGPATDSEKGIYVCPTYCTPQRRPYYVFPAQLKTKQPAAKWVLAGVALILDIGMTL